MVNPGPVPALTRLAYAAAAAEHGWSRNVLEIQLRARALERQGKAVTNFERTLPPVIEIRADRFKPEHMGQPGFYMTAVGAQVNHAQDSPTIGRLLCRTKNEIVAEYPPLETLPTPPQANLPTIEQLERELGEARS